VSDGKKKYFFIFTFFFLSLPYVDLAAPLREKKKNSSYKCISLKTYQERLDFHKKEKEKMS
jgi:hypothetical protein